MTTVKVIDGQQYQIGKLNVLVQLQLAKRLLPVVGTVLRQLGPALTAPTGPDGKPEMPKLTQEQVFAMADPLIHAVTSMADADTNWIIETCLGVVSRQDTGAWLSVWPRGAGLAYNDLTLPGMMQLVFAVVMENIGGFLPGPGFSSAGPAAPGALSSS